jgi:hypothetical protein
MNDARDERRTIRAKFSAEYDDGATCGVTLKPDGAHEPGGYPQGFLSWPLDRRNSWFAGFNAGYARRRASNLEAAQ